MGIAICIRCGAGKSEAFVPCPSCGLDPAALENDRRAQAQSLYLSEAYLSAEQLKQAARLLQSGKPYTYDDARLEEVVNLLRTQPLPTVTPRRRVVLGVWVPVLVGAAVVGGGLLLALLRRGA